MYPTEIENALTQHPSVKEAYVFGVADERLGEEIGAVVVLQDGYDASLEPVLNAFLTEHVSFLQQSLLFFVFFSSFTLCPFMFTSFYVK